MVILLTLLIHFQHLHLVYRIDDLNSNGWSIFCFISCFHIWDFSVLMWTSLWFIRGGTRTSFTESIVIHQSIERRDLIEHKTLKVSVSYFNFQFFTFVKYNQIYTVDSEHNICMHEKEPAQLFCRYKILYIYNWQYK